LEKERKIKFWLSTIAKSIVVVWILIKIVSYFSSEKADKDINTEKSAVKENIQTPVDSLVKEQSPVELDKKLEKTTLDTDKEKAKKLTFTNLEHVLRYKGKVLEDAYFEISDCQKCISTRTTKNGIARITIPTKLIRADRFHDFYVYASDTLVYHRAMRFSNLDFNKY